MRTIQEVGLEIMSNQPKPIYFFGGVEYGIKSKYLEILKSHYDNRLVEASSVNYVMNLFSKRQLFPIPDSLYVVRYDEEFISQLSEKTSSELSKLNIKGTLVCLYQEDKHTKKLDKYLPDYTVSIDGVAAHHLKKYLTSDFPKLSEHYIDECIKWAVDYNQAKIMCNELSHLSANTKVSDSDIAALFGKASVTSEDAFRIGIASRNLNYTLSVLEEYEGDYGQLLYSILNVMIEIDRCLDSRQGDPELKKYVNLWTRPDIYYMFSNTYSMLKMTRSISISDIKDLVTTLCCTVKYHPIPDYEVMLCEN